MQRVPAAERPAPPPEPTRPQAPVPRAPLAPPVAGTREQERGAEMAQALAAAVERLRARAEITPEEAPAAEPQPAPAAQVPSAPAAEHASSRATEALEEALAQPAAPAESRSPTSTACR